MRWSARRSWAMRAVRHSVAVAKGNRATGAQFSLRTRAAPSRPRPTRRVRPGAFAMPSWRGAAAALGKRRGARDSHSEALTLVAARKLAPRAGGRVRVHQVQQCAAARAERNRGHGVRAAGEANFPRCGFLCRQSRQGTTRPAVLGRHFARCGCQMHRRLLRGPRPRCAGPRQSPADLEESTRRCWRSPTAEASPGGSEAAQGCAPRLRHLRNGPARAGGAGSAPGAQGVRRGQACSGNPEDFGQGHQGHDRVAPVQQGERALRADSAARLRGRARAPKPSVWAWALAVGRRCARVAQRRFAFGRSA